MESQTEQSHSSLTARATWFMVAKIAAFILNFILPLMLVRRLSPHEFGVYKQVFLVVGTAITLLPLGFGMSAYYFLPREPEKQGAVVFNILIFYTVIGLMMGVAFMAFPSMLAVILHSPEFFDYGALVGMIIVFWVMTPLPEMLAVAKQEPRLAFAFVVSSQFVRTALLVIAAVAFASVKALMIAAIIQGILQLLMLLVYLHRRFPGYWQKFDHKVLRRQLSYALPLGFAGLLYSLQSDLHNYFAAYTYDAATFAIYAIGCFQLPLVGILSESVCSVMIGRISVLQKQDARQQIIELMAQVMRKLAMVYFPLYGFLMVAGRDFIIVLFTDQYLASWSIFAINLTMLPVSILVLDPVLRAYAEQRYYLLKLRLVLIGFMILALWAATRYFGLIAIISVVVFFSVLERIWTAVKMGKVIGVRRSDNYLLKDIKKVALSAAAAAIITFVLPYFLLDIRPFLRLVVMAIIFSVSYLSAFLLSGILTADEWEWLRRQALRLRRSSGNQSTNLSKESAW
ncbi:MAG: oligosaccharide flippase family protein [Acidobacteriota bacterium]